MATKEKSAFAADLGNRLRRLRGARSFSEIEAATGGTVSARLVQYYEDGTEPRYGTLLVLLAALGTTPAEFAPDLCELSEARKAGELARRVFGDKAGTSPARRVRDDAPSEDAGALAADLGIL